MNRGIALRAALVCLAGFLGGACTAPVSSSGQALSAPEPDVAPRVYIETMLFLEPPGGLGALGVNPAAASFGDIIALTGSHHVSAGGGIVADDAIMRMPRPDPDAKAPADPLDGYVLAIKPHVLDGGRIRLGVDLTLASKKATTSVVLADKQLIIMPTEIMVEDRCFILLVRPNIVRSDDDLQALLSRKMEALHDAKPSPMR